MTLEAWVYPTAAQSSWRTIIQREGDAYFLHASNSSGALRPAGGITGTVGAQIRTASPSAIPLNTRTHLALTHDGSVLRLYVNGSQVASQPAIGGIISSTGALRMGGNQTWGQYFLGRIDEVRIYSRALSASEILGDMNTGL